MAFDLSGVLDVHATALKLRSERTQILASNLANQNTPGYQAMDVDFKASMETELAQGFDRAQAMNAETARGFRIPFHAAQDGNTVELGVEQAAFAQNANDFSTSLTFVNMKIKGLMAAISGNT